MASMVMIMADISSNGTNSIHYGALWSPPAVDGGAAADDVTYRFSCGRENFKITGMIKD